MMEETIVWFDVKDKMPQLPRDGASCDFLVMDSYEGVCVGHITRFAGSDEPPTWGTFEGDGETLYEVTHWAEMPKGPQ